MAHICGCGRQKMRLERPSLTPWYDTCERCFQANEEEYARAVLPEDKEAFHAYELEEDARRRLQTQSDSSTDADSDNVGSLAEYSISSPRIRPPWLVDRQYGASTCTATCNHAQISEKSLVGMSSATETLCGQAFGAKQYYMMGIYLQRSWIIDAVAATLMLQLFIFATPLFKLIGLDDSIVEAVQGISLWFIGALYASVFNMTTKMYLQAQRRNMVIGLLSPIMFMLHVLLSWIFVSKLHWGISGAMSALVLSRWLSVLWMIVYVFGGWCPDTWSGFSLTALLDLIPIVKLSIYSGVMMCVQLWYTSILVLLAGYTNNETINISAFSISLNIITWVYMINLSFLSATSARVANETGKGNARGAKLVIKLTLTTSVAFGLLACIICLVFGRKIPYLFTSNDQVASAAAKLSIPLSISLLLSSFQAVLSGVAIGTGSQAKVAIVNICSYYIIGIPIGCVLAYVADYGIMGFWIGLISGRAMQVIVLIYMTWRIDWKVEVNKSQKRLHQFFLDKNRENNKKTNNDEELK